MRYDFGQTSLILLMLVIGYSVNAEDLGEWGQTWPIVEADPIAMIQQKLSVMADNGELAQRQLQLKQMYQERAKQPEAVSRLLPTAKCHQFYYDPSIVTDRDIRDHQQRLIVAKNTKFNPLDKVSINYELIFFNATIEQQLNWAVNRYNKADIKPKLILISGRPIELQERYHIPFYFDQSGVISNKFGLQQVPAIVKQQGKKLLINEVKLAGEVNVPKISCS
ncbi:MAG: type-F conjugative transfer system protein TraW [Pseudomonadota bacterium]